MDRRNISSTFLSLLVIAVMLLSYSTKDVSLSNSVALSQQSSFCKNAQQTLITKDQPSEITKEGSEATSTQGSSSVSSSCNISLQVIPVEKRYMLSPGERSLVFPPHTTISSQAFVFQEPDPPQTV